jgi:hypothetical protein
MKRAVFFVLLLCACDDTIGNVVPLPDASVDAPSLVSPATFGRGEYIAKSVAGCGECHTPRDENGNLDMSRWMSGAAGRFDVAPYDDTVGSISAPNLTPDKTGIGSYTDDQVRRAFMDGVGFDGSALAPVMPYYVFHNMTDDDARAIIVYLRSLPPIVNTVPQRQPLPVAINTPRTAIPDSAIPHTTLPATDPKYAQAENGRYLAAKVGFCMDCHSPWRFDQAVPLDVTNLFAGGRAFSASEWSVPAPAPAVIYSYNITPHDSGIKGWTPDTVAHTITTGLDDMGAALCRPMPSGPGGALGGLTADDALAIGIYVTTLPPIDSGSIPQCPR